MGTTRVGTGDLTGIEPPEGEAVASAATYAEAQRLMDHLSDQGFPVEQAGIVGYDLRLVEDVTGRRTKWSAALEGAATGAWFGLLVGILFGLFSSGVAWIGLMLGGLALGAVWGAVLGFALHWSRRGRRDFSSRSGLVAGRYDIVVRVRVTAQAKELLHRFG